MLGNPARTAPFEPVDSGLGFIDIIGSVVGGLFGGGAAKEPKKEKAPPAPTGPGGAPIGLWAAGLGAFALMIFILRGPKA